MGTSLLRALANSGVGSLPPMIGGRPAATRIVTMIAPVARQGLFAVGNEPFSQMATNEACRMRVAAQRKHGQSRRKMVQRRMRTGLSPAGVLYPQVRPADAKCAAPGHGYSIDEAEPLLPDLGSRTQHMQLRRVHLATIESGRAPPRQHVLRTPATVTATPARWSTRTDADSIPSAGTTPRILNRYLRFPAE